MVGCSRSEKAKAEMGTETTTNAQIPTIDFSGLDLNSPGSPAWDATRARVLQALDSVGFFAAGLDQVSPELRDEIFGPVASALFSLPVEVKQGSASDVPYAGYVGRRPGTSYEILSIDDASRRESVQAFTNLMWPQGNPSFCDTVWRFTKQVSQLELMARRMVLESLGAGKHFDSHAESTRQTFRINEYLEPEDPETMIAMGAHKDLSLMSIVYQYRKEGLELLSNAGQWLRAPPNTFMVMLGETLEPLSNGRLNKPTLHRVRMTSKGSRYSITLASQYRDGVTIQALEELVSDEHPMIFKPYEQVAYTRFRFSEAGHKAKHPLKAYCGVNGDDVAG